MIIYKTQKLSTPKQTFDGDRSVRPVYKIKLAINYTDDTSFALN